MKYIILAFLSLVIYGCSTTPDEKDIIKVAQNIMEKDGSDNYLRIEYIKKTNGIMKELSGQQVYNLEFEAKITIIKKCYYGISNDEFEAYAPSYRLFNDTKPKSPLTDSGYVNYFTSYFQFTRTDNGWLGPDGECY